MKEYNINKLTSYLHRVNDRLEKYVTAIRAGIESNVVSWTECEHLAEAANLAECVGHQVHQLESIAKDFPGVDTCYALQAGREVRVVVEPEKINEAQAQVIARDICNRIEKEMTYPGQIKVTIIRETRSVEYAK